MKMIQTPICSLHILLKKTLSFLEHPTWMSHELKGSKVIGSVGYNRKEYTIYFIYLSRL